MKLPGSLLLASTAQPLAGALAWTKYSDNPRPLVSSGPLQDAITTNALMANLQKLDSIGKANGGNRAFGLPGYAASVEYILSRTENSSNFITWTQDFPALFNQIQSIKFTVENQSYFVLGLQYSPSTSKEGLTAPLVLGAAGDKGCTAEGYANIDVKGKIVLVQRGSCPDGSTLAGRLRPAAAAGAVAVIIYNNADTPVTGGTLSNPDPDKFVPGGFINRVDGLALVSKLENRGRLEAYFQQTQVFETRITQNVFTETKDGDPNNIVMLGAHLDSVQAGPGINDDGSGTSLILEVKTALENFSVKNKVRFAWWGAEENGLLGSAYYTKHLNASAASSILTYLNFDMVSRGYFGVFDGDGSTHGLAGPPGSDVIEKTFVEDMTSKGINVTAARFTGGSDYASFMSIGKPVGGLHTGTGVEQDPCYHQACDTINNPNPTTLTINAKAAAHVLSVLATKGEQIIPKSPVNSTTITSRGLTRTEIEWTTMEDDKHLATCGHDV
ncbi:aminopeptidase-like protein Y [Lindgomyces ingoldianus]|uniref:Aminopeptidase-like protein Y n=1 Tax=Lindgomyces ingoldianus TaxID=673940 RepID=A0ACB6QJQ6_9PLEO|nr:aminopeptidase-like protein Y [Lindgomyces ingoldianus]KAF2467161.1 aminopeptidase-like protein Y [Lindgomyces ingoldianus]